MRVGSTSATAPAPSVRERAVVTARLSFQKRRTPAPITSKRPRITAMIALLRHWNQDFVSVTVKLSEPLPSPPGSGTTLSSLVIQLGFENEALVSSPSAIVHSCWLWFSTNKSLLV